MLLVHPGLKAFGGVVRWDALEFIARVTDHIPEPRTPAHPQLGLLRKRLPRQAPP